MNELEEMFSTVSDVLETAAAMSDPLQGRRHVIQELEQLRMRMRIPASNGRRSDGKRAYFIQKIFIYIQICVCACTCVYINIYMKYVIR